MWSTSLGKVLTSLGVVLIGIGACSSYVLEKTSSLVKESGFLEILEVTFFPLVLLGLAIVLVGCSFLAVRLPPKLNLQIGLGLALSAGIVALLGRGDMMPLNVHNWTAALFPPLLALLPLAILFVGTSIVRMSLFKEKGETASIGIRV